MSKQFVTVVENIHNTVNYSFDSKHCEAFGVLIDKDLNVQIEKIDSSTDIYDMLDTDNDNLLNQINKYDMVSFATNGWAAPIAKDNDDEYSDLSNDALLQVINKLVNNRLVYTPGRAPVFNLLTTTIHRCMFSLLNKKNSQKAGLNKLLSDSQYNLIPKINRSLKTLTHNPRK